jgi:hypothetical protein
MKIPEPYDDGNSLSFTISPNQDSASPFFKAFEIIEKQIHPEQSKHGTSFFDDAAGYFIKYDITVHLEYTNWFGTELYVEKKYSEEQMEWVKKWLEIIIAGINN